MQALSISNEKVQLVHPQAAMIYAPTARQGAQWPGLTRCGWPPRAVRKDCRPCLGDGDRKLDRQTPHRVRKRGHATGRSAHPPNHPGPAVVHGRLSARGCSTPWPRPRTVSLPRPAKPRLPRPRSDGRGRAFDDGTRSRSGQISPLTVPYQVNLATAHELAMHGAAELDELFRRATRSQALRLAWR
jgi:hypothetical protein